MMMSGEERLQTAAHRLQTRMATPGTAKKSKNIKRCTGSRGWRTQKLGSAIADGKGTIHTGPFGSQLHASDYVQEGIPCIMPANMKNNRVDMSAIAFIGREDAQRLSKYLVQAGDIVYSRRGDVTQKALIRQKEAGYFCGTGCLLIRPGGKLDSEFLTYFLSIATIQDWIVSQSIGGTMPNLNTGILKSLPVCCPDKSEQEKIAAVLSSLDAKIELNNRINAELEAMAKQIYDYWFVQFDFPFDFANGRPALNGRPYKSSGGKMVYNPQLKRKIPEGWADRTLCEIADITMGQSPDGSSYNDCGDGVIFFQGSTDFGWRFPRTRQYTTSPARMAKAGDILLSVRAPVGTRNVAADYCCIGRGLAALRSRSGYNSYLLYLMGYFKQIFDSRDSTGTTFGAITKDDLFSLRLAYPDGDILKEFDSIVAPCNQQIRLNHAESLRLEELRDWLLPMLMNGQVTVNE